MKIKPNINTKYKGVEFIIPTNGIYSKFALRIIHYKNRYYILLGNGGVRKTNISIITKNFKDGYWKQVNENTTT